MTLTTDTLYFNRASQLLFYKDHAVIKDETNVLKSKNGNYYLENKKFTGLLILRLGSVNTMRLGAFDYISKPPGYI